MSLSLIVVLLGAVVAVAGTAVLASRCAGAARGPGALGAQMVAWTVAIVGLAVALGCQVIGDLTGYGALMFRAMELGGQLVAPLALCLGLAQVAGRSVQARFAMWLAVSALTVVALVILGTDPLSQSVAFSTRWPDPAVYYQLAPKAVLEVLALFTFLIAVIATLATALRSRRDSAAVAETRPVLSASAAAALLAVPGLAMLGRLAVGLSLPLSGRSIFALVCTGAAGLTWFAGMAAARLNRAGEFDRFDSASRAGRYPDPDVGGSSGPGGSSGARRSTAYRDDADPGWNEPTGGRPADGAGGPVRYPGLAALAAEAGGPSAGPGRFGEAGGFGEADGLDGAGRHGEDPYGEAGRHGEDPYGEAGRHGEDPYGDADRHGRGDGFGRPDLGRYEEDHPYGDMTGYGVAARPGDPGGPSAGAGYQAAANGGTPAQLFGQITIYTLIEERSREFDHLTERIVAQVKEQEPGTLVYIVHAVPTAPMQRILYEVYRDRLAYDDHLRQPYIARYEAERRPLVLATNVIELGLQQAKVSPFPSFAAISDILSESGIDLTGVTGSPRGGRHSSRAGLGQPTTSPPVPAASPQGGSWPEPTPSDRGYQNPYQGWDEIRGEDQRRR